MARRSSGSSSRCIGRRPTRRTPSRSSQRSYGGRCPLHHAPHEVDHVGIAGSAACLVREVAPYITKTRAERTKLKAAKVFGKAKAAALEVPSLVAKARAIAADPETKERLSQDVSMISDLVRGKAMERFRPLAQKLMGKAIFENNPEVAHLAYNEEPIAAEEE